MSTMQRCDGFGKLNCAAHEVESFFIDLRECLIGKSVEERLISYLPHTLETARLSAESKLDGFKNGTNSLKSHMEVFHSVKRDLNCYVKRMGISFLLRKKLVAITMENV